MARFTPNSTVATAALCLTILAAPAIAGTSLKDYELQLTPDRTSLTVDHHDLLIAHQIDVATHDVTITSQASHGTVFALQDQIFYSPGQSFWTVGVDSFNIRIDEQSADPSLSGYGTILVLAAFHGEVWLKEDFENGTSLTLDPSFAPQVDPSAAIGETQGLEIDLSAPSGFPLLEATFSPPIRDDNEPGQSRVLLDDPTNDGGRSPWSLAPLMSVGSILPPNQGLLPAIEVILTGPDSPTIYLTVNDGNGIAHSTSPVPITENAHDVRLAYWPGSDPNEAGAMLHLDGKMIGYLNQLDLGEADLFGSQILPLDSAHGAPFPLHLDDFELRAGRTSQAEHMLHLTDGFEEGTLLRWSNAATSNAAVNVDAAIHGDVGLEVDINGSGARYIEDDTLATRSYGARFNLDTNTLFLPENEHLILLSGSNMDGPPSGQTHFQLRLRGKNGGLELKANHREVSDGGQIGTGWHSLVPGQHNITVQWRAASRDGGDDGFLRLWLNGQLLEELTGLENGDMILESVRFGAKRIRPGMSGSFYLDDYVSWR